MSDTLHIMNKLSAAEDFFEFLGVPYDASVVHVNRLHILKRLNQYMRMHTPPLSELSSVAQHHACRELLRRSYEDFTRSTPGQERVFKVFQDAQGAPVAMDGLRSRLQTRTSQRTGGRS